MGDTGLNLAGLGLVAAGGVLLYSAVNDPVGGPIGVVRDLLRGRTPTPGVRLVTGGTTKVMGPVQPAGSAVGSAVGGNMGKVLEVARSYLGSPYRLGGTSKSGIDCSGLVLVAYRDGAGISLPHKATLQAARGRRVPRDQARPGDLVAWGVPGNYPHIALVVDSKQCIGAWTWGVPCKYGPIDQKAVPGFGYPDIIRLVG
jgi:cell wall-associated NlpC family hydrolase